MNRSNVPINDDLIQAKAKEFAEYFKPIYDDIDKCSFSIGTFFFVVEFIYTFSLSIS